MEGLEPPRLAAPDPKSGAATNYATCANFISKNQLFLIEDCKDNAFLGFSK